MLKLGRLRSLLQARLRGAKKEEPEMNKHLLAGVLGFVTLNFILCIQWLGG